MAKPCQSQQDPLTNSSLARKSSPINLLTTYYHTPDFPTFPQNDYHFYVMLLRDPLDRTISAFTYMHPKNVRARGERLKPHRTTKLHFFQRFPTLEHFAQAVGDAPNHYDYTFNPETMGPIPATITSDNNRKAPHPKCIDMARASLQNQVPEQLAMHFRFDTKFVVEKMRDYHTTLEDKTFLAIRNDYLWQDWTTANQWLDQNFKSDANTTMSKKRDHSNLQFPVTTELSDQGRQFLCGALVEEYKVYVEMLMRSHNLQPEDVLQSLRLAQANCPWLNLKLPC